jgi:hypothetical protein
MMEYQNQARAEVRGALLNQTFGGRRYSQTAIPPGSAVKSSESLEVRLWKVWTIVMQE